MQEVWQPVRGWETRYEVSSLGRVRSLPFELPNPNGGGTHTRSGRVLKPALTNSGYLIVRLCRDGLYLACTVHSLVAHAFLPPCPGEHGNRIGQWNIDHINEAKTDNRACNLRWLPRDENRRRSATKLTPHDIESIRKRREQGEQVTRLAEEYNKSLAAISQICSRKTWRWVD